VLLIEIKEHAPPTCSSNLFLTNFGAANSAAFLFAQKGTSDTSFAQGFAASPEIAVSVKALAVGNSRCDQPRLIA
jgi:hypothetical protein